MNGFNLEIVYILQPFKADYNYFMTSIANGYMSDKIFSKSQLEEIMFKG